MLLVSAIIFITSLLQSEQIRNRKDLGIFVVVPQDTHFIEFEENEATLSNTKRVMSIDEWNHVNDLNVKTTTVKIQFGKDPKVFCRKIKACQGCVSRKKRCSWCHESGCNTHKICNNRNPNCPTIEHTGRIFVPAGMSYNILVKLTLPDPDLVKNRLLCVIRKGDRVIYLPAEYFNGEIKCASYVFDTDVYGDVDAASLKVLWGGFEQYSNKLNMFIFRCHTMAMDCGSCGILPAEYGCGWCNQLSHCTSAAQCRPDTTKWSVNESCLTDKCAECWTLN